MTTEDDLTRRARALPRSIEPDRDLWPDIAARLDSPAAGDPDAEAPHPYRWRTPLALAAGVLLVAFVGFWMGRLLESPAIGPQGSRVASSNDPVIVAAQPLPAADLRQTRAALVRDVERRLATLPPSTRDVVVDNLQVIGQALDDIDAALTTAPASGLDTRLLMSMYADQLVLLNSMNNTLLTAHPEITL